jgi:hypothetical protein
MQNYFNYFTEIEERFQQRRGSLLMLSTLDWALIETWRSAGVPLESVLRGIDDAFDRYEARSLRGKGRVRRVNGLAWCAQSVMEAVEATREAAVGAPAARSAPEKKETGFEGGRVAQYLERNAAEYGGVGGKLPVPAAAMADEVALRLRGLAMEVRVNAGTSLEELDRTLTVLEERMFAAVLTATEESELVKLKESAARELAPYRGKMGAVQIRQVEGQFLQKRLMEALGLPRLSLFYMSHDE